MLAHYQILERMGEGAMGTVYCAHDTGLDRKVAVKVLRESVATDQERVDRFAREARAAARVSHPNLTHIYYVGSQGSWRFFAMELLAGEDLELYAEQQGPVSLADGIDMLVQAARGLAAAHKAGVVHRDVKPSNIIRRPDGTVKITDFGLSKSLDADVSSTQAGQVMGTPTFMSPEQCRGESVDTRTDIYSLGLTAYYLFTGVPAFPGPSIGAVINDQINTPLPRLTKARPDLPEALEEILDEMCAKDRERRPEDMDEVIELLETCRPRQIDPAPLAVRAVALGLDAVIVGVVVAVIATAWQVGLGTSVEDNPWIGFVFTVLWVLDHLGGELWFRQSLGKRLMHIHVCSADGTRANRKAILLRLLIRFPTIPLHLVMQPLLLGTVSGWVDIGEASVLIAGAICYFVTARKTLSDLLTGTRVVYQTSRDRVKRRKRAGSSSVQPPTKSKPKPKDPLAETQS